MTWQLDAAALSALLDAREITPLQLLDQTLARLDALEPVLNAFTHVVSMAARIPQNRRAEIPHFILI
jgi:Asp-tRNA(Asn)/Glu-tRNA(Gln) amidotransferase A subunit family amidase